MVVDFCSLSYLVWVVGLGPERVRGAWLICSSMEEGRGGRKVQVSMLCIWSGAIFIFKSPENEDGATRVKQRNSMLHLPFPFPSPPFFFSSTRVPGMERTTLSVITHQVENFIIRDGSRDPAFRSISSSFDSSLQIIRLEDGGPLRPCASLISNRCMCSNRKPSNALCLQPLQVLKQLSGYGAVLYRQTLFQKSFIKLTRSNFW
ncbi:hypothetical protein AVEN_141952-1 [Araneus ventricosus]|uniref:Uncharacterized protein n=1 Tax=Araneus ventricosus TaxID=182803 RepID=A0A4Y2LWJ0_ARAVE|nr:hypothetical protein AVEN_141952-1 [Araneus ventricosus]